MGFFRTGLGVIQIAVETPAFASAKSTHYHKKRCLYNIPKFDDILSGIPPLEITLDFSTEQLQPFFSKFKAVGHAHDAHIVPHQAARFVLAVLDADSLNVPNGVELAKPNREAPPMNETPIPVQRGESGPHGGPRRAGTGHKR